MKSLCIITICLIGIYSGFVYAEPPIAHVKKELILVTQKLQSYEQTLSGQEKELRLLRKQEHEAFTLIAKQQHVLASALQSLKHWRDYSPILIALSSVSLDDLVHSFLVLQSCTPRLDKQNRSILEAIKKVGELRAQIQKLGTDYINLKTVYQEGLKTQATLFESKFQDDHIADTLETKQLQEKAKLLKTAPLEEVLNQLQAFFASMGEKKGSDLKLIYVAVGEHQPVCKVADCSSPSNNFTMRISVRPEAQVVSPCDARVVYIGSQSEKSQLVILRQDSYFIVLSGLGSVNCRVGESLIEGEPIGCALSRTANALTTEGGKDFKSEEKIINLQLRKGSQFLDLTPYLRPISNDKKI